MRAPWIIALVTVLAGCGGKRAKPGAAASAPPTRVDAERAGKEGGELLRAAHVPHQTLLSAVGAHKLVVHSKLKVSGEQVESLDEDTTLEVAADGSFHLLHQNTKDYGQDVVLAGGAMYVRPRYGQYLKRPPEPGESERLRDEAYGTLGAYLDVVGFALETRGGEAVTAAGRPALKVTIAQGGGKPARVPDDHPERKWRESVKPAAIEGSVTIDSATGAPLAADVHVRYQHDRAGAAVDTELTLQLTVAPGAAVAAPPAGAFVDVPVRERPVLERDQLLGVGQ